VIILRFIWPGGKTVEKYFTRGKMIQIPNSKQLMKYSRKNVTILKKNLLSNRAEFPIVRLNAPFLVCGGELVSPS